MNTTPSAALFPPHPSNAVPVAAFNYHHPHATAAPLRSYRFSPYSIPPIYIDKEAAQLPSILDLQATVDSEKHPSLAAAAGDNGRAGSSGSSRSPSSCGALGTSPASGCSSETLAVLTERELWKSFDTVGNEMIVTKPGRRLFPTILVTVTGLIPSIQYTVKVRFVSADKYRHKYISGHWTAVGESDIIHDESEMVFVHPSSPCYGEMWIKKPISFKSIKITHHIDSQNGNILLHTMHKYRIEVVIIPHEAEMTEMVFPLANSDFIAVTSYQSSAITKLKVDNNPFAKGFRDREAFATSYSNHSYQPFLSPPYTPFIHNLWKGSVFPAVNNLSPMFPSSGTGTPTLIQSPTTSIPHPPPSMVPCTTMTSVPVPPSVSLSQMYSSITNMPPHSPMFQPFLPPVTNVPPVFSSMTSILSPTTNVPQIYPSTTSLPHTPVFTPMSTPLIHPPPTTSVPLVPLSPVPSPSLSGYSSNCSIRTCSAGGDEEDEEEKKKNK